EEAPTRSRGQAVSVLALLSGVGTGISVIAYPILAPNWRLLFFVSGVGLLAAPLIWWLLPEGKTWQGVRVTGSALRLLMQAPWRPRVLLLAAMFALLAVLLEPAGLLYTVYASAVPPVSGAWSGELFPTRARATAEAAIALAGAIGSIAGLQAVGLLSTSTGLGGAIELGGVAAVGGALLLFLLPETKQQPLPE